MKITRRKFLGFLGLGVAGAAAPSLIFNATSAIPAPPIVARPDNKTALLAADFDGDSIFFDASAFVDKYHELVEDDLLKRIRTASYNGGVSKFLHNSPVIRKVEVRRVPRTA